MPISVFFNCPGCNARIKAPVQFLGTYHNCPGCNTRFIVRSQPQLDGSPLLVKDGAARQVASR